jgi:O-antigen/teichoic acid export membrane protein
MSFGCTFDVLNGVQRADLNYKLNLLGSVIDFCVTLPLLLLLTARGLGLFGMAIGYTAGQVLTTVMAWFMCKRVCPKLVLSPFRFSRDGLRKVTSLGGRFQALSFMNIIFDQGVKLVLSRLLGLTSVGVYELAYKLIGLGTTISSSLLGPLMPAFANLHAGEGQARARELFLGSSKAVALTAGTALGFVGLFADQLVLAWTGVAIPEAAWTLRALVATKFLVMLTGVPTASLRGRGTIRLEMWFAIVGTVCLLASIYPLYRWAGYHGVIYARIVEDIGGAGWFLWAYFRSERLPMFAFARDVVGRVVLSVGAAIAAVILLRAALPFSIGGGLSQRWAAAVSSMAWGGVFAGVTAGAAWLVVLTRDETKSLVDMVRRRIGGAANPPPATP